MNEYDLISSKLIRGTEVDYDDCLMLVKAQRDIDIERLKRHSRELVSYDVSEGRIASNIEGMGHDVRRSAKEKGKAKHSIPDPEILMARKRCECQR